MISQVADLVGHASEAASARLNGHALLRETRTYLSLPIKCVDTFA